MSEKTEREKEIILKHQLEEWKCLNDYINKMDMGYQNSFVIIVSVFALITTVLSSEDIPSNIKMAIFIIPLGLVAIFAYISYQFRITAILRGHLAALEEKMNRQLKENVHMWNSALVESYMAHNNTINSNMMIPMMIFIGVLCIYCVYFTWEIVENMEYGKLLFGLYWLLVLIGIVIVLPPFFENEKIRMATYEEEKVWELYSKYKRKRNESTKKEKRNLDRIKKSVGVAIANFILGFGVMFLFWNIMEVPSELNGLFHYYAATIGDAVFLSIFVGAGIYYCQCGKGKIMGKAKRNVQIITGLFLIIGILMQLSWLVNSNIELNWTIDKVHHFNIAGWYHAVYFVAMFGVISNITVKTIYLRSRKIREIGVSYLLVWLAGMGYWYMHLIDDCLSVDNYLLWLVGSFIVFMVSFFVCEWVKSVNLKENIRLYFIYITSGIVMTVIVIFFCKYSELNWDVIQCFEIIKKLL